MNALPLLETEPLSPEANHRIFTALAREMTRDTPVASDGGAELVEDATISYLQPDEPARRNRRPWLLALVAVAAAVLGVGIMVRDNSARTRTNGDVTPETMPIYLPTWLPDGFTFANANDYTNRQNLPFRDQIYRDPSKPIGGRVVQITTSLASAWGGMSFGHPIVIQGRTGFDESDRGLPALRLTDGQVSIHIGGRGVSYAEVEQIASSAKAASTDPTDGAIVGFLPDGLNLMLDRITTPPNRNISATYAPPDDNGSSHQLNVNIWPASSMNLDQWAVSRSGELTQTKVRGHDTISVVSDQNASVVWSETTGVLIEVDGLGMPVDQVRRAAESLRQVGSKEWANLLTSKDIPIQDDGAPGSPVTIAAPTTAAGVAEDRVYPWSLPLLVPRNAANLGQLRDAADRTVEADIYAPLAFSHMVVYREAGTAPGSRALQIEWATKKVMSAQPAPVEGQAPFADAVTPQAVRDGGLDPNGLFFRLSGRGFAQGELETIAGSLTTPLPADRITVPSLPVGLVEVESRDVTMAPHRSTTLDYGAASIAMNPVGIGTIESYAIETPGTFNAAKVRGHDAYVVTDPATITLRLVWVEAPGLLIEIKANGSDIATLQRLAESLQPVSTDAWKKLLATVGAKPETVKVP
jgi:hypothetical protein